MKKPLISPEEVVEIAFETDEIFSGVRVNEATILSAEQKFVAPALGGLYDRLLEGAHEELLDQYIKTPLALYVKWLMLPALAIQSGRTGVVQMRSEHFLPADSKTLESVRRRVKADARALMRCAIDHIEQHPTLYPDYVPADMATVVGNIVL